jgi:hypothetical protein
MSEPREKIRLPDGRFVEYQGLAHFVSNLLELYEVTAFLDYRGDIPWIFKKGLFDNPSLVVPRIADIHQLIRLDDPEQQRDIFDFLSWLEETCIPFLDHAEQHMPDVRHQIDSYLTQRRVPPLHEILCCLRSHFFVGPSRVFCCIFLRNHRGFLQARRFLAGLAITQFNGNPCYVSQEMAVRFGLTIVQFSGILLRVRMLPQIKGKSFWRKVRTLSIAQIFLIRRLLMLFKRSNICGLLDFRILMRVLSRFFR